MVAGARSLLRTQYAVMAALTQDSRAGVLEAVGNGLEWDFGTLWEVDQVRDVLIVSATWARDDERLGAFRRSAAMRLARGEEHPGRAWASRELCWSADLATDPPLHGLESIQAHGLRSGLWLPVISNGDALGVVELLSRARRMPDRGVLDAIETIGRVVGLYLHRVRTEQDHRDLESQVALGTRALVESERQLRALAERIQTIREEERTALAREIHDVLGQELTGLKMDAGWISRRLAERADPDDHDPVAARTRAMIANIDATIGAVRRISSSLRPRILDDLGLIAAIECLARELRERSALHVELVAPDELPLPAPLATAVYRILQELVTNVIRHAEARRIDITLAVDAGVLELRLLDDGKGIPPRGSRVQGAPSLGLLGIRERARTFGGAFAIGARTGGGTEATLRIPLDGGGPR